MRTPSRPQPSSGTAEVIDFDDILLAACGPALLANLLTEAAMLAQAFAPEAREDELAALAQALSSGARDEEIGRSHALKLAAMLRRLSRQDPAS